MMATQTIFEVTVQLTTGARRTARYHAATRRDAVRSAMRQRDARYIYSIRCVAGVDTDAEDARHTAALPASAPVFSMWASEMRP